MKLISLEQVRTWHSQNELEQAKAGYLALLDRNPHDSEILHALGVLFAQQEDFSEAIDKITQAVRLTPNNPSYRLHLANIYRIQGSFNQAIQTLTELIQLFPAYTPALNNLGTIYFSQGNYVAAELTYRKAITAQPEYIDAYYNLGLSLARQNKLEEAIEIYLTLLSFSPQHFAARFHLANLYLLQDKLTQALQHFLLIEEQHPHHFETQTNLATCYLKQGRLNEAKQYYKKALTIIPDDVQILFNLGVINMEQGNIDQAIQYYQRAVNINPELFAIQNNLGVAFLAKQHIDFALQHFTAALHLQPENKAIQYTVDRLKQSKPLVAAPPEYIKSLFDSYADHYESHLLHALEYQLPKQLYNLTAKQLPKTAINILDLGCGTGLCGELFKSHACSLTGVDLSEKMLAIAAEKNCYSTLKTEAIEVFLADKIMQYDLIIAGDALVYFGDLTQLFNLVNQALKPQGLFVFNTEITEEQDFKMTQSGRFAHDKQYLTMLAKKQHFTVLDYQTIITRQQNNLPVYGHLFILQRE